MEGLIPFVYRAIVEYKNNGGGQMSTGWYPHQDSPPAAASYMRLPSGDSGRFQYPPPAADSTKVFGAASNCSLSFPPPKTNRSTSSADQVVLSTGTQSPISRRVVNDRQMALIH